MARTAQKSMITVCMIPSYLELPLVIKTVQHFSNVLGYSAVVCVVGP